MKRGERLFTCALAGLALCGAAHAVADGTSGSPYQGIVERNVFGLKPAPPPPGPEANKPPPPKIFLTGITSILGRKLALMKLTPPPKPGEPAKEESFTLAEGQREGELEVLEIDEKAGTVKVSDYGTVTTLDFVNNGVKVASAPGPGAGPNPAGMLPRPGAIPMPGAGAMPLARPMRLPTPTGATSFSPASYGGGAVPTAYGSGSAAAGYGAPAYGAPLGAVALPGLATGASQTPAAAQPQESALSGEAQAAMLLAQQVANKNKPYPPAPPPIQNLLSEPNNSAQPHRPRPAGPKCS